MFVYIQQQELSVGRRSRRRAARRAFSRVRWYRGWLDWLHTHLDDETASGGARPQRAHEVRRAALERGAKARAQERQGEEGREGTTLLQRKCSNFAVVPPEEASRGGPIEGPLCAEGRLRGGVIRRGASGSRTRRSGERQLHLHPALRHEGSRQSHLGARAQTAPGRQRRIDRGLCGSDLRREQLLRISHARQRGFEEAAKVGSRER